MNPVVLDIPNDPAGWPQWLERQLVGLELADLVEQLHLVVKTTRTAPENLAAACGGQLAAALERGLSALSAEQVRTLLRHPDLLLEMQERVLADGGDYWRQIPITEQHEHRSSASLPKIKKAVGLDAPQKHEAAPLVSAAQPPRPLTRSSGMLRRQLTAAAAVLLVVTATWVGMNQPGAVPAGWGFDKPGLLTAQVSDTEYLNTLADAANAWFNKRPETSEALVARLEDFRHGCDTLLAAPHSQLAPEDKAWLLERCGLWKGKIEAHIADLQQNAKPLEQVREESDATINALMNALRTRAEATA